MAYNLARYNLSPFNLRGSKEIKTKIIGYETVSASIGTALQIFARAIGYERVANSVSGNMAFPTKLIGRETIDEVVTTGFLSVISRLESLEEIAANVQIVGNIDPLITGQEAVTADIIRGADISTVFSGAETVTLRRMNLGAKISSAPEGYELVSASINLEAVDMKTTVLTVTLKPGERLIVDASSYNVLLNGENAIDIHSGDWIDELTRETQSIVVSAAAGAANLSASILYTERYL